MAKVRDGKIKALCIQPQPNYIFENGEGYTFKMEDFVSRGVKLTLTDRRDDHAVELPPVKVRDIVEWLTHTTGQPANAMPIQLLDVLKKTAAHNKAEPFLGIEGKRVLNKAIKILRIMSPFAKQAIRKRNESVPKQYR